MDIKQLTEKLSKSSTSNNGKYVPWWSGWENDSMCRYDLFSAEEIAETDALIATATAEELTAPVCAYKYTLFHLLVWHNFYNAVRSVVERKIIDADVTEGGGKGVTPLMLACFYSNHEMFKLLVRDQNGRRGQDVLALPLGRASRAFVALPLPRAVVRSDSEDSRRAPEYCRRRGRRGQNSDGGDAEGS